MKMAYKSKCHGNISFSIRNMEFLLFIATSPIWNHVISDLKRNNRDIKCPPEGRVVEL